MTQSIVISGFGGQGILFAGKVLAEMGMAMGKKVSWLPSYGPEMRGGTANCNVIISDEEVGSPIVNNPDILVCMNKPSLAKFEDDTKKGGFIFVDSSLVDGEIVRDDVKVIRIPATMMHAGANLVMVGKMIKETMMATFEQLKEGLKRAIPAKKQDMLEENLKAIKMGWEFEE